MGLGKNVNVYIEERETVCCKKETDLTAKVNYIFTTPTLHIICENQKILQNDIE